MFLAIGVNGQNLHGCWQDVKTFKKLMLNSGLCQKPSDILALVDRPESEQQYKALLSNIKQQHYTIIYLSGHGSKEFRLCLQSGQYLPYIKLHEYTPRLVIFDCCHSGNAMQLRWSYRDGRWHQNKHYIDTSCTLITLSSCAETEQSYDMSDGGKFTQHLFKHTRGGKDLLGITVDKLSEYTYINATTQLSTLGDLF